MQLIYLTYIYAIHALIYLITELLHSSLLDSQIEAVLCASLAISVPSRSQRALMEYLVCPSQGQYLVCPSQNEKRGIVIIFHWNRSIAMYMYLLRVSFLGTTKTYNTIPA